MVPAPAPPHKPVEADPGPEQRLALCRAAVRDDPRFEVSAIEMGRDGPSYTVDTLDELHKSAPDSELYLIVGGDVAAGFRDWRQPERVLSLATLAVAKRRGTPRAAIEAALAGLAGADRTRFFAMPRVGISSTDIRARIRENRPIRYLVPDAVASHIGEHRLYQKVNP
jgi:nicotinate-nucleotide adenylyltransferase